MTKPEDVCSAVQNICGKCRISFEDIWNTVAVDKGAVACECNWGYAM